MKNVLTAALALLPLAGFAKPTVLRADEIGIRAPEGFEVSLYAGDELAHDIYSMTFDSKGRVVVAGRGYVKILHDEDNDGRAEKATLFSEFPKSGAHGMVFLGNDLVATGDNLLMRLKDEDGDGKADGKPIPLANVKSPEHGANGLAQGPDGWIYMICGNDAGVGAQFARTKTSPVKKPQAGTVVRFSPDFKTSEIFAHGFRNPYDLAFNANGHLFTVDADGERDQYLPWYAPTRLFDIQQGMHHGWVQRGWTRSWNRPEYFFDNVERLVEIGRGSPTGVECYRHYAFPKHYRGGIYSCCWTLGTVYYFPLQRDGASYKSKKEIFLQTTGDVGFAPVDLAVGPKGDMFVAIGGRGTRGSVFRVRYTGELKKEEEPPAADDGLVGVLNAPQPLAAWSRAKWMPLVKKLRVEDLERAAIGKVFTVAERMRAIEVAVETNKKFSRETVEALLSGNRFNLRRGIFNELPIIDEDIRDDEVSARDEVAARANWMAARQAVNDSFTKATFWAATYGEHDAVLRAALEAIPYVEWTDQDEKDPDPYFANWADISIEDRRISTAIILALEGDDLQNVKLGHFGKSFEPLLRVARLHHNTLRMPTDPKDVREIVWLFDETMHPRELEFTDRIAFTSIDIARKRLRASAVRLLQLQLGDVRVEPMRPDVYAGYTANAPDDVPENERLAVAKALNAAFPTNDHATNLEIARVMGMLEVEGEAVESFAKKITGCWNLKSSVQDDVHFLIVLSRLPGQRNTAMTEKTADTLSFLHFKMLLDEMYPSRNWPLRVGEAFVELCKRDPKLAETLATHRDFGMPQHAMFAKLMPEKERKLAARRLLERAKRSGDDAQWTPEMVSLIAALDEEDAQKAIRRQWENFSLRDAIVAALYRQPQPEDRQLFIDALSETNPGTVARAAEALTAFGEAASPGEIAAALSALRHQCINKDAGKTRAALAAALEAMSEQDFEFKEEDEKDVLAAYKSAFDWFANVHPAEHAELDKLAALDGVDWEQRLSKIDWLRGEAASGAKLYESRACAKCHAGGNRLGPALDGVTGRWSRDDLIKEIVDPNRNVAPQFLTSRLETIDGKVYHGVPIYQSPDGTLLQTGAGETIRIAGPEVVSISQSRSSLMPTGLLRGLSDEEIADLYAYLKTLAAR